MAIKSFLEFGRDHADSCRRLCSGLSPYTKALNQPVEAAIKKLDARTLRLADASKDSAYEVINGIVPYPGRANLDAHVRYVFAYSLYAACSKADLTRYLCSLSAMNSGEQLEMILIQALKEKAYGFIHLTGGFQLEELGQGMGFYYFVVAASAFRAMAAHAEDDEYSSIAISMANHTVQSLAPIALDQCRASEGKTAQLKNYIEYTAKLDSMH
jgi:hypothetical protein